MEALDGGEAREAEVGSEIPGMRGTEEVRSPRYRNRESSRMSGSGPSF